MFIVAISPLMFSPGDDAGVFKSIRLSVDPLVDGPGTLFTLVGEVRLTAALLSPVELGGDEPELPSLCGVFLLLLRLLLDLPPLLG